MALERPQQLITVLRAAINDLKCDPGPCSPGDVLELERIMLRYIAEVEAASVMAEPKR